MATRGRAPRMSTAVEGGGRLQDYPRHERNNPLKVHGTALRELGHRHGIPKSSMDRMDEAKLRRQISIAQENATQEQAAA